MNKKILMGVGLAASVFGAPGAWAVLNDSPYFNLWTTGLIHGGTMIGQGTTVNLCGTSACNTDTSVNKVNFAEFSVIHDQPAGSGYIDPFLRFHHMEGGAGGNASTEAAYNTNYRDGSQGTGLITAPNGLAKDYGTTTNQAKDSNAFNHVIRLGDLQVSDGMVTFKLDINEPGEDGKMTLRLDELAFFVAESDDMNSYFTGDKKDGPDDVVLTNGKKPATMVWNMDWNKLFTGSGAAANTAGRVGGLNLANINDSGKAGSGDYDMQVRLAKSLFLDAANSITGEDGVSLGLGDNAYVYLYNFAGQAETKNEGTEAESGFEEWAAVVDTAPPPDNGVPEPSTALLLFGGLAGMLKIQRQRKASQTSV